MRPFGSSRNQPVSPTAQTDHVLDISAETLSAQKMMEISRRGFIKKVYGILTIQILLTTLIVIIMDVTGAVNKLATTSRGFTGLGHIIFWICLLLVIGISISLTCFPQTARRVPINYFLLLLYTLAMSFFLSVIAGVSQPKYVITALILTVTMTMALTFYACKTKREFGYKGAMWFLLLWLVIAIPINIFLLRPLLGYSTAFTVLSLILVVFYAFFLIFDTKLIVGQQKSRVQLGVDEYIIGALMLYSDIVGLFIALLSSMRN